ncbi:MULTISPECIES: hypothetical protein [unclassified Variovorax]|nr:MULTISPECIES: hypothetical protein [unclassified Variovorax]PNG50335.1 hypothetical protein CHC06_05958 [Variovorax sp. B2]PNG51208.1 hypothetical protein CHC07_05864 [Variovorax sp. B4]VTV17431.1 hypothetical protein WDL1P1_00385 [Variovorax sp. WDL1]
MQKLQSPPAAGQRLTAWLAVPGAHHCSMRCIEGTDINEVANRVAFIEKTPRVRNAPFTDLHTDYRNWHPGSKGDDGWDAESQAWCDGLLLNLGYVLPPSA